LDGINGVAARPWSKVHKSGKCAGCSQTFRAALQQSLAATRHCGSSSTIPAMIAVGPLTPEQPKYRCAAASSRFGPIGDIAASHARENTRPPTEAAISLTNNSVRMHGTRHRRRCRTPLFCTLRGSYD
jgi:hypothetical protein